MEEKFENKFSNPTDAGRNASHSANNLKTGINMEETQKYMQRRDNTKFLQGLMTGIVIMLLGFSLLVIISTMVYRIVVLPKTENSVWSAKEENDSKDRENGEIKGNKTTLEKMIQKINLLGGYIDNYYLYDVEDVDYAEGIYKGMLASLNDVYSVYYTKEEYALLLEHTNGNYCGLGAYVSQDPKTGEISIVQVIKGSAAEEIGMISGDIIYRVDGKSVEGEDLSTVVSWLKGEEGTKADIEYYREGQLIKNTITRRQVETESVAGEMLKGDIGYIQITTFADNTKDQFHREMENLKEQGAKGIIIDLRDNGGGVLETCVDMVNCIVDKGVIVSTKTKAGAEKVYEADNKESCDLPIIILINGNSASASEVFSGALKDHGKATLIGTKSFGKGIVQTVLSLDDGSAIKLTTAEYFTPSGSNIQDIGIEPDIEIELDKEALKDGYEKEKDNQLNKAVEVMEGMVKR